MSEVAPSGEDLCVRTARPGRPAPGVVLELLKPVTWFAPMWAFGCGIVSSGVSITENWLTLALGVLLAGPLLCGTSQAANDWIDRHVDAINEPDRPIPSGRMPGRWGLYIALIWTGLSLVVAWILGEWVFYAALIGMALAWGYSMPPFRLKNDGWLGNAAAGFCYEGLPWFAGAAAMLSAFPAWQITALAGLYALGAHGIMTLNDFKAIEGDRQMGIKSLPARFGTAAAARLACVVMALPQAVVIALLVDWDRPYHALAIAGLLLGQGLLMIRLLADPKGKAAWYNATGTTLYVIGMLISAFAVQSYLGGTL